MKFDRYMDVIETLKERLQWYIGYFVLILSFARSLSHIDQVRNDCMTSTM